MRSLIILVDTVEVFFATSSASSRARANVASGDGSSSENNVPNRGESAGYTEPVVVRCSARECPINRGKKYEEQASIIIPLLLKTKPTLAFA
jgi:hypothetical protein